MAALPADIIIAREKLTSYLLVPRAKDDKSRFLSRAGFVRENADQLEAAIRRLAADTDAVADGENEYGVFLRIEGQLAGPLGSPAVALIWMRRHADGSIHFVTLKPAKEKQP